MSIIVLIHDEGDHPGRLGDVLRNYGFHLDTCRLWAGDELPPTTDQDVDGLIVMGGTMNVTDQADHPWMKRELQFIREAHADALPIVGICFGCQLVAEALGGAVAPMYSNPAENSYGLEFGWHDVRLTFPGTVDTLFTGFPWTHRQLASHACEVTELPTDGVVLASSNPCRVQAYRVGLRTYGFQFHFEVERDRMAWFSKQAAAFREKLGLGHGEFMRQVDQEYDAYDRLSRRLCQSIGTYLMAPSARRR